MHSTTSPATSRHSNNNNNSQQPTASTAVDQFQVDHRELSLWGIMNLPEEGVVLSFTEFSLLSLYQVVLFGVQRRVSVVQQTVRTEALSSLSPFLLTHTNSLLLVLAIVANCFLPFQIIICLSLRTCKHRTRRNGNKSSSWVHRREGGGGGQGTVVVSLHAVNCGRHSLLWLVCWPLLFDRVHHGWRIKRIKSERVETVHEATTTGNVFEF